jgi:DNA-binding beta-propeller fold protein YncE
MARDNRGTGRRRPGYPALLAALIGLLLGAAFSLVGASSGPTRTATAASPNGWTAYVVLAGSNSVMPIDTADNTPGGLIPLPAGLSGQSSIAINANASTAYVSALALSGGVTQNTLTPIDLANPVGLKDLVLQDASNGSVGGIGQVAVTPDGTMVLVAEPGRQCHGLNRFGGHRVKHISQDRFVRTYGGGDLDGRKDRLRDR